jgi:hypothetical protein
MASHIAHGRLVVIVLDVQLNSLHKQNGRVQGERKASEAKETGSDSGFASGFQVGLVSNRRYSNRSQPNFDKYAHNDEHARDVFVEEKANGHVAVVEDK